MSSHSNLSNHSTAHIISHFPKLATATSSYASRYHAAFTASTPTRTNAIPIPDVERSTAQRDAVQHTNDYYDIVTRSFEAGWGKQFHYAPFAPGDSVSHALTFVVYRLAHLMGLKKGMRVLDIGCGIGGPTREVAKFCGVEVIGVSINRFQVNRAIEVTAQQGLGHLCAFIEGNYMHLVDTVDEEGNVVEGLFPEGYFDAVVAIESMCHAPSWEGVYRQVWRVLKPGGVFGFTEQVMVDEAEGVPVLGEAGGRGAVIGGEIRVRFNEGNAEHVGVRNRLEVGTGISQLRGSTEARATLRKVGYEIEADEDFARYFDRLYEEPTVVRGRDGRIESWSTVKIPERDGKGFCLAPAPKGPYPEINIDLESSGRYSIPPLYRPWWYPLMGNKLAVKLGASAEDRYLASQMSHRNRKFWFGLTKILVWLGVWPASILTVNKTMTLCVDEYLAAGSMGIFTPCWMFVSRKPESCYETQVSNVPSDTMDADQIDFKMAAQHEGHD